MKIMPTRRIMKTPAADTKLQTLAIITSHRLPWIPIKNNWTNVLCMLFYRVLKSAQSVNYRVPLAAEAVDSNYSQQLGYQ